MKFTHCVETLHRLLDKIDEDLGTTPMLSPFQKKEQLVNFFLKDFRLAYGLRGGEYSWTSHRLQTGLTLVFLLWLSNFKTETSFGFLSPNYTGHVFWIFSKNLKMSLFGHF